MTSSTQLTFDCQSDGSEIETPPPLPRLPPTFPLIPDLCTAEPNNSERSQTGHNIAAAHNFHRRKPDSWWQLQTKAWRATASWQPSPFPDFRQKNEKRTQLEHFLRPGVLQCPTGHAQSVEQLRPLGPPLSCRGTVYASTLKTRFLQMSSSRSPRGWKTSAASSSQHTW